MSNGKEAENYEVGYCKPPAKRQFQKGRSGNPKGRPKGTLNMATVLARALRERVVVNVNGKRKTITKMQAAVTQLVNQAASGDLRALRQLMSLAASAEQRLTDSQPNQTSLNEEDQEVMAEILKRFQGGKNED